MQTADGFFFLLFEAERRDLRMDFVFLLRDLSFFLAACLNKLLVAPAISRWCRCRCHASITRTFCSSKDETGESIIQQQQDTCENKEEAS